MDRGTTLIVGGGIAGMSCALKLRDAGLGYMLLTENLGGRICYLKQYDMNFGAVFFMQGYRHAKEILAAGEPVLPSYFDLECHQQLGKGYGVVSGPIIGSAGQLLHFMNYLKGTFKPHYEAFKLSCETKEIGACIADDPYIKELFDMTADKLVEKVGFPKAAKALVSQFVYACTGSPITTLNALDYLNCAMGLVDTATRFTFDPDAMRQQLTSETGSVKDSTVVRVERNGERWAAITDGGDRYEADNLVLATPADITQGLLSPVCGTYPIREASELHAYKVAGKIKKEYAGHKLHLFDQSIPLINIGARPDGAYEVFTCKPLDMNIFFDEYEVVHRVDWERALFTHPSLILEQDLGSGLYRAGDHNALGLEPAAISGVFAANRIISQGK